MSSSEDQDIPDIKSDDLNIDDDLNMDDLKSILLSNSESKVPNQKEGKKSAGQKNIKASEQPSHETGSPSENQDISDMNDSKNVLPKTFKAFEEPSDEIASNKINCLKHLNTIWKYEIAFASYILLFAFLISLYGIIIINYIFFVSSISCYVFSPIYHGLCKEWFEFAISIIQIIVASPLIDFYFIYILQNIKYFFETIQACAKYVPAAFRIAKYSGASKRENFLRSRFGDFRLWRQFLRIFGGFIAFWVAFAIFLVQIVVDKLIVLTGLILYVLIVFQILGMIFPAYVYYFQCLLNLDCSDLKRFSKILNWYDGLMKRWKFIADEQKKVENGIQTYESSFQGSFYENLENSSDSGNEDVEMKKANTVSFAIKQLQPLAKDFYPIFFADSYHFLIDYTNQIAYDKIHKGRKCVTLWIFTFLNLAVLAVDIYRLTRIYSSYFLASIILRFLMFPLLCYFNIMFVVFYKIEDIVVRCVRNTISVISIIFIVAIFAVTFAANPIINNIRIDSLPPPNYTQTQNIRYISNRHPSLSNISALLDSDDEIEINTDLLDQAICTMKVRGLDLLDAFGYSFGPYDVERDPKIFNNQMSYFFGPDWNQFISYKVFHIRNNIPFIVYNDTRTNLTIVGFRGFSSGEELAVQIQMIEAQYVNPFFTDIVPFYDISKEYFLNFYLRVAHNFGLLFFDTQPMISPLFESLVKVILDNGLNESNVIYTGLNVGGTFAKLLSAKNNLPGISFLSYPIYNDYLEFTFDLEDENSIEIYNIFNFESLFSMPEPDVATNIGYYSPDRYISNFCTAKICNFAASARLAYQNFCAFAENCGKGPQFDQYCRAILGDKAVDQMRQSILEL